MTLRARLAIALAVLAALAVAAVAAVSYAATAQRLRDEVDGSLVAAARQPGPGVGPLTGYCTGGGRGGEDGGYPSRPPAGLPGGVIQCVDAAGRVDPRRSSGPPGVPVDRPGVDLSGRTRPRGGAGGYADHDGDERHPTGQAGPSALWTQGFGGQRYRVVAVPLPGGGELRIGRSLAETDRVLGSVRNNSILVGLVITVLAAAAGVAVARRTTRPVTRLTDAAEAIAASGRLEIAVPEGGRGRDEIGRLARAFSAMLAALTRSREQQQRLVQDAGHELRTPLTSLRANIDTLRRYRELEPASRDRLLSDLDGELRELTGLVDELVALAVDRYDDEPEQTVKLDALSERAADRARRRSGRSVLVDAEPAPVVAKPQQLLRAVGNLLENAVKFSPDGTPIELTVRPGRLQVRDHGPGIPAGDVPHVFDRFYRAVGARSLPGSGLGLAIVRQVVEDGGGSVHAANHPDGGVVFTVELPPADGLPPGPPAG
ncbi:MAG TPA: HAMP domain-containing sensor histidine kinase [Actinomycetota bacterium]